MGGKWEVGSVAICIGLARALYVHRIRLYGNFPARLTSYTPYTRMCVWFWPTLHTLNSRAFFVRLNFEIFDVTSD